MAHKLRKWNNNLSVISKPRMLFIYVTRRTLFTTIYGNGLQRALNKAEKLVDYPSSFLGLQFLLGKEAVNFAGLAKKLVGTSHPLLATAKDLVANEYYSSRIGGLWVLLVSKGTKSTYQLIDESLGPTDDSGILLKQRKLAEITEAIQVAYLIHRGILTLDVSNDNKNADLKALKFGNKLAILGGDYILARASLDLARLQNVEVLEQVSKGLEEIVEGATLDIDEESRAALGWENYVYKCHASLLAYSCKAAATLGGQSAEMQDKMFNFGKYIGMVQTLKSDLRAFENGDNINISESNTVLCLAQDQNVQLKSMCVSANTRPSDIHHSNLKRKLDYDIRTEIATNARNRLLAYIGKARVYANSLADTETRECVYDILDNFNAS